MPKSQVSVELAEAGSLSLWFLIRLVLLELSMAGSATTSPQCWARGGEVSLSILELALVWPGHQRIDGAERRQSFLPNSRGFRNKRERCASSGGLPWHF